MQAIVDRSQDVAEKGVTIKDLKEDVSKCKDILRMTKTILDRYQKHFDELTKGIEAANDDDTEEMKKNRTELHKAVLHGAANFPRDMLLLYHRAVYDGLPPSTEVVPLLQTLMHTSLCLLMEGAEAVKRQVEQEIERQRKEHEEAQKKDEQKTEQPTEQKDEL